MPLAQEEDDWVFDTVKPTRAPMTKQPRKRLSRIPSDESSDIDLDAMGRLALHSAPLLGTMTISSRPSSTIQTPQAQPEMNTQKRRTSALTARKVSVNTPTAQRKSRDLSGASVVTARRVSGQKQPLEPNISFGNGTSTVRQFRRVSSETAVHPQFPVTVNPASIPQLPGTPPDSDIENRPASRLEKPVVVAAASKEAVLGRRAYNKALEPSLQECLAQTSDTTKRADIYRVAEAWTQLDSQDPEGTLLLLKAIIGRVQSDPKLAAQLMPQHVAAKQLASLRLPKTPHKASPARNRANSRTTDGSNTSGSPLKGAPSSGSPSKGTPAAYAEPPRRRRQSRMAEHENDEMRKLEAKLPGRIEPGLEHIAGLADGLYGRWCEGLQARWALA